MVRFIWFFEKMFFFEIIFIFFKNVVDWDKTGNNDFLGVANIPVAAVANAGRPLDKWFPLLDK